jgi:hypothetical protein
MVDVGNVDLFANTWQAIYAAAGNQQSVLSDTTVSGYNNQCNSWADGYNLNVKVTINGQWGTLPGAGPHDSREALVQALWATLQQVSYQDQYNVFSMCYGFTWQESAPDWAYASGAGGACGCAKNSVQQNCGCSGAAEVSCRDRTFGHKVPSLIKANLYDANGELQADSLEITFASQAAGSSGGCSKIAKVAAALIGLIPGTDAALFSTGINVSCLELA